MVSTDLRARLIDSLPFDQLVSDPSLFNDRYRCRKPLIITDTPDFTQFNGINEAIDCLSGKLEVMYARDSTHFLDTTIHVDKQLINSKQEFQSIIDAGADLIYYRQPLCHLINEKVRPLQILQPLFQALRPNNTTDDDGQSNHVPTDYQRLGIWIGSCGNITPLHYDSCHVFMMQLSGRKRWTIIPPSESRNLYCYDDKKLPMFGSDCDAEEFIDCRRHLDNPPFHASRLRQLHKVWPIPVMNQPSKYIQPNMEQLNRILGVAPKIRNWDQGPLVCDLKPGEILYNPAGFWHEVVSIDACVSLTIPMALSKQDLNGSDGDGQIPVNFLY